MLGPLDYGRPYKSPLDLLKFECLICGQRYWRKNKARDCCKGTPEHAAYFRRLDQRIVAAEAEKRGKPLPYAAGIGIKECPDCHGKHGNLRCQLCDGNGFVPDNVF